MNKGLQLHIPVPCHENWNQMTPGNTGRFCLSCKKSVVDFSTMTDQQILLYFKKAKENTCGRFREDQLNRNFEVDSKRRLNWLKYFIHFLIPTFVITSKSYGQGLIKNKPTICVSPKESSENVTIRLGGLRSVPNENSIYGKIMDEKGQELSGATIQIKGSTRGTLSDVKGVFALSTEKKFPLTIIVSSVGFTSQELTIYEKNASARINIYLNENRTFGGEVVVVGYSIRKPKPNVYHQFKRLITDSLKISTMKMYPNPLPVSSILTMEYPLKMVGEYRIEISDLNGKLLQSEQLHVKSRMLQEQIRVKQGILTGSYLVTLYGPDGKRISSQKLLIQN